MEKTRLINKLRKLTQENPIYSDMITVNRSEYAILMQTFGISWDELKQPSDTSSSHYKMVLSENDLRQLFKRDLNTLKLARDKGLHNDECDMKHMIKGFLNGVRFFNPRLSDEFALIADGSSMIQTNEQRIGKSTLINKLRALTKEQHISPDRITTNEAEIAILMQTFGISWDELKQPSDTFYLYYKMVLSKNDLRRQLELQLNTLKRAKEKGLIDVERETKNMIKGFLNGVEFFNPDLFSEFSLMADGIYNPHK
ncbi:hypothetical protein [Bacillus bombysepticus]|uniref:hypothetical protein n=1 Tax=Bacillus bombysepticus TaxID=658666 RepID=UPI00301A980F